MQKKGVIRGFLPLLILFSAVIALSATCAHAKKGGMTLLAVSENADGYEGSIADLYLDIREGDGSVFVDTFPASKVDTQISMRFAKQIACKYIGEDCSEQVFLYTIRASSGIVGGPSAGAAAAVLTVSLLKNMELQPGVAMTGTINSGGTIGPVGGLKEKIDVAAENGFTKVLVPKGESIEVGNISSNISDYAAEVGIEIIEVSTLDEAVYHFTGKSLGKEKLELKISPVYEEVMKDIASSLCGRASELEQSYLNTQPVITAGDSISSREESAFESKRKGDALMAQGSHYSAASYCFSSSIKFRELIYTITDISGSEKSQKISSMREAAAEMEMEISSRELSTISDLQAFIIVDDRVQDAVEALDEAEANTSRSVYWIAYAEERYFSILNWVKFFGKGSTRLNLNNETMRQACMAKISEANERVQYVKYYFPSMLDSAQEMIDGAHGDMGSGRHALCIFKASKAKADANIIMSVMGVENSQVQNILEQKISAAEQAIAEQQENGIFPIMAYSYLEYAKSLGADDDQSSALLYAEYALELSNFDIYFGKSGKHGILGMVDWNVAGSFAAGAAFGAAAVIVILIARRNAAKPVKNPKRKRILRRRRKG